MQQEYTKLMVATPLSIELSMKEVKLNKKSPAPEALTITKTQKRMHKVDDSKAVTVFLQESYTTEQINIERIRLILNL